MIVYYKKINIPNYEVMRQELLSFSEQKIAENARFWDLPKDQVETHAPTLYKYLLENFHRLPALYRFYNTPPFSNLVAHIDNTPWATNRIGLNVPLAGVENTQMNYYTTPEDNLELRYAGFVNEAAQFIKDKSKLVLSDTVVVDQPTLLRTDCIHDVVNDNPTRRIVMGMKFIGREFDEVYKHSLE
jgi:hypothetical protein